MTWKLSDVLSRLCTWARGVADRVRVDGGQGLVEYALIITLVVVVAIVSLGIFGTAVTGLVEGATANMPP